MIAMDRVVMVICSAVDSDGNASDSDESDDG